MRQWVVAISLIYLTALMVWAVVRTIPRAWSSPAGTFDRAPSWWRLSPGLWRGVLRSLLVTTFGLAAGVAGAFLGLIDPLIGRPPGLTLLILALAGGVALGFGLMLTIILFNWPKLLVPPPMRSQRGTVDEWLEKRRGNRARPPRGSP